METWFSPVTVPARQQFPHSLHYEMYFKTATVSTPASQEFNYLSALGTCCGPFGFCLSFLFLLLPYKQCSPNSAKPTSNRPPFAGPFAT